MSQRLNAYFVKEAGEYLAQIETLLSGAGERMDGEKLMRLVRGVRGSAQMAGATGVAPLTERLESAARAAAGESASPGDGMRRLLLDTVRETRALLQTVEGWGESERERVAALLARWDAGEHESRPETPATAVPEAAGDRIVPISALFYDDAGPHVIRSGAESTPAPEVGASADGVIPIERLLLRGPAAARAALALRTRLEGLVAGGAAPGELAPLHDEIFDLLELSLSEATA